MKTFLYSHLVCYEDTDAGGVVYHSKYLNFAEQARMSFLHENGITCKEMAQSEKPCGFMIKHCEIDFKRLGCLEDELIVETTLLELRGAGFDCLQVVKRGEETLVEMKLQVVCVTPAGRPTRIPENIRTKLAEIS
ncbi:MAG: YbgC/FadM family acyl-CoA thioesterase [Alphaproteobacteria bacterium]|nr:YbgC/FadM family acyl-CoA thioesterase [Alphaproteobacteria bacterium]